MRKPHAARLQYRGVLHRPCEQDPETASHPVHRAVSGRDRTHGRAQAGSGERGCRQTSRPDRRAQPRCLLPPIREPPHDRAIPVGNHTQPPPTSLYASRRSQSPGWDASLAPTSAHLRSRPPLRPPKPPQNHPLPPASPPSHASSARPPAPASLALFLFFSAPPPTLYSLLCLSRPSPPLHSPSRLSTNSRALTPPEHLYGCLGGVRARHRPQTPINTGIECGHAIHTPVHSAVRTSLLPLRPKR